MTVAGLLCFLTRPHDFPSWDGLDRIVEGLSEWDAWVAIGTLALAASTFVLALHTRSVAARTREEAEAVARQVAIGQQQVEVTRESLQASIRPLIADAPRGVFVHQEEVFGRMHVRDRAELRVGVSENRVFGRITLHNAGPGLALIQRVNLIWPVQEVAGGSDHYLTVVPAGQLMPIEFAAIYSDQAVEEAGKETLSSGWRVKTDDGFIVEIEYTDMSGAQLTQSRATVAKHPMSARWWVRRVELYRGYEVEPFAVLTPMQEGDSESADAAQQS